MAHKVQEAFSVVRVPEWHYGDGQHKIVVGKKMLEHRYYSRIMFLGKYSDFRLVNSCRHMLNFQTLPTVTKRLRLVKGHLL